MDTSQQPPQSKISPSAMMVIGALFAVTVIAIASAVFFYLRYSTQQYTPTVEEKEVLYQDTVVTSVTSTIDENGEIYEKGEDMFGVFVRKDKNSLKDYSGMFPAEELKIEWYQHPELMSAGDTAIFLEDISGNYTSDKAQLQEIATTLENEYKQLLEFKLYTVGTLVYPSRLKGQTVYVFAYPAEGLGLGISDVLVIRGTDSDSFIALTEGVGELFFGGVVNMKGYISGFIKVNLGLNAPQIIGIPQTSSILSYYGSLTEQASFFERRGATNNRAGIVNLATGEIVSGYPDSAIVFQDPTFGPVYFVDNEYRIILEDGSVQTYELVPSFLQKQSESEEKMLYSLAYTADVTWNTDFSKSYNTYVVGGNLVISGCAPGVQRQTNIVNTAPWFDEDALREVGKTKSGEGIFVLNNPESRSMYKDFFAYGGEAAIQRENPSMSFEEIEKIPQEQKFADFLANDPIIFWKDYRGLWRMYMKSEYQSLAECGKPVIYLYPEETIDISVEVAPSGGLTYTDPVYPEGGWFVNATPESQLYSYREDTVYPYLFWEGHADGFSFSDKGFVFSRETLASDMRQLLQKAGLNETETTDFLDFWVEKMKDKPYVFVTFANQQAFERAAPLRITPRPDSVLRLFMYFEPLDAFKIVTPLPLFGFERRGFSVVEWGGVLTK